MPNKLSRREILKSSATSAAAGLMLMSTPEFLFPNQQADETLVPFLDMPRTAPNRLDWETLDSWITPQDQVFNVQQYGMPEFETEAFRLEIAGLVERPRALKLEELKSLPRRGQLMTLECSGNGVSRGFMNAFYNSKWTGTPLASLLQRCGVQEGERRWCSLVSIASRKRYARIPTG